MTQFHILFLTACTCNKLLQVPLCNIRNPQLKCFSVSMKTKTKRHSDVADSEARHIILYFLDTTRPIYCVPTCTALTVIVLNP